MRRLALGVLVLFATTSAQAAPVARVVQYRSAKGSDGRITSSLGSYQFIFIQPGGTSPTGYVTGEGMLATPAQPGLFDATKPWVIATHKHPDGSLACFTATNLVRVGASDPVSVGQYALVDRTTTTHDAWVVLSIPCADGTDSVLDVLWYAPPYANPPGQFAWTFPFGGGAGDPSGNVAIHGVNYDAYFTVCGDVSGCAKAVAQSYWRIYDANLTITR